MYINNWIHINNSKAVKDGQPILSAEEYASISEPQDLYRKTGLSYMKFFKMDLLCKWAWLGAELLLQDNDVDKLDKAKVAVVMMTEYGCLDVDKKYEESRSDIPSPALFVYTLPNIMLGEICIKHGFKGEQLCTVSEGFDITEMNFWVNDLLENKGMDACLCGWADAYDEHKDICLFWITKENKGQEFTTENLTAIYNS